MFSSGIGMARDNPILGLGPGLVQPAYADYRRGSTPTKIPHLHNNTIQITAERGAAGLLAYLTILGVFGLHAWRALQTPQFAARPVVIGCLMAVAGVTTAGFFEYNWGDAGAGGARDLASMEGEGGMSERIYSVAALIVAVNTLLEQGFSGVRVEGEVTNASASGRGHIYFSLKDDSATIDCVMWSSRARRLKFELEDGLAALASGSLTIVRRRATSSGANCSAGPISINASRRSGSE